MLLTTAMAAIVVASHTAGFAHTASRAQQNRPASPQPRKGSAESSLIGVHLFDTGLSLIARWGSPQQIIPLAVAGGGGAAPGGGGGGGGGVPPSGGRPGGPPAGFRPPASGAGAPPSMGGGNDNFIGDPFGQGDGFDLGGSGSAEDLMQRGGGLRRPTGSGSTNAPAGGGGAPGVNPGGGGGGPAAGGGGGGPSGTSTYTRWVYNRDSSRYAFVLDQYNRIIQIEAMGIHNRKVHTRRGITFGSSFGQIITKYNSPDAYEIGGNNMVLRYLVADRVAFRLAKLDAKKPHVVTGIVIAAGQ